MCSDTCVARLAPVVLTHMQLPCHARARLYTDACTHSQAARRRQCQRACRLIDPELEKYWMPVDMYVGGAEHAVLHLLYARFWHKVLYDLGVVTTKEPFRALVSQGMILGETEYSVWRDKAGDVCSPDDEGALWQLSAAVVARCEHPLMQHVACMTFHVRWGCTTVACAACAQRCAAGVHSDSNASVVFAMGMHAPCKAAADVADGARAHSIDGSQAPQGHSGHLSRLHSCRCNQREGHI